MNEQEIQVLQSQPSDQLAHNLFDKQVLSQRKLFGLMVEGRDEKANYDTIQNSGYDDGAIYIAKCVMPEKQQNEYIRARVFVGLKDIQVRDEQSNEIKLVRAGYLFDIQARGDDSAVIRELLLGVLEQIRSKHGASVAYLAGRFSTLSETKLRILQEIGFKQFDERFVAASLVQPISDNPLLEQELSGRTCIYHKIQERPEILEKVQQYYKDESLYPGEKGFKMGLILHVAFKGCYVVETDDEGQKCVAGICLFEDQRRHGTTLQRFGPLSAEALLGDYFRWYLTDILYQKVKQHRSRFLRIFAPFYQGDEAMRDKLFGYLLYNITREDIFKVYQDIRINLSAGSPFIRHFDNRNTFMRSGAKPVYFLKVLSGDLQPQSTINTFFDPRDL